MKGTKNKNALCYLCHLPALCGFIFFSKLSFYFLCPRSPPDPPKHF